MIRRWAEQTLALTFGDDDCDFGEGRAEVGLGGGAIRVLKRKQRMHGTD